VTKTKFEDPLEGVDPIMEQACSSESEGFQGHDLSELSLDSEAMDGLADTLGVDNTDEFDYDDVDNSKPQQDLFDEDYLTEAPIQGEAIDDIQFPNLTKNVSEQKVANDVFSNIPVSVSVELGRSRVSLKEVFELTEGSIIELERLVGEPLDLVVNGQVIAQGEVVAIDNNYGLRVTNIISSIQN